MRLTLNWRFLFRLGAVTVVAAVAVHFVHRAQVKRQVGSLLRHADEAREAGDADREIAFLHRYLRARPGDLDARERLARKQCDTAKPGDQLLEGYLLVQDVLRQDPARHDLRRYAVELAMSPRLALYPEARADLDVLLGTGRKDLSDRDRGELEELYARCLLAAKKFADAERRFAAAVGHRPDLVDAYAGRATLLRVQLNQPDEADAVVAAMLAANPADFRSHLTVAEYWRTFGRPDQAAEVVAKAVARAQKLPAGESVAGAAETAAAEARRLAPNELDVVLLGAAVARDRGARLRRLRKPDEADGAFDEARRLLTRGLELHPKSPRGYLALAALDAATRQGSDAVATVRKGLEAVPATPDLVLALFDYQALAGDAAGAAETLDRLKAAGFPPAMADYQQARILVLKDDFLEASRHLDRARQDLVGDPGLARQASLLLGQCYKQLGNHDLRLVAYRRALPVDPADPLWVPAQLGIAEAEAAQGRADAALASYRKLKDQAVGAWVQIATLEMIRALQTSPEKRDWRATEEAVAAAGRALPDATEVALLRADLLHHTGHPADARKALDRLRAERPKEAAVWIAVARQDLREGDPVRAAATLDAAEKEAGDSPDLRLARARLFAETKAPDLSGKIAGLAAGAERFGGPRQRRFLRDLAQVAGAAGAEDAAGRLWERVGEAQPNDLGVQLTLYDRAVRAGDEGGMDRALAAIVRVDGKDGPAARLVGALSLIWRAQHKNDPSGLPKALIALDGLARERAGWGRVAFAQALVYELQRDPEAALAKYQQAVEYGESSPDALRRLMALLSAKGRFAEAEQILRKLPDATTAGGDVSRLAAEVSLRSDNPKQALEFAARAVSENSTEPRDHIWRGQVYWAAGSPAKAEPSFRRAVALAPGSPDGWLTLIEYLAATGRPDDARTTLAEATGKVSPAERSLFLAVSYARLGDAGRAGPAFRQARTEHPDDLRTVQAEAEFLFQAGRLPEAREAFQRVIGLKGGSAESKDFARRMLAICLAADRDYETSRKALELLGLVEGGTPRPPAGDEPPAQRRSRALALALQRDRESKLEAIRVLETLRDDSTPSDRYLLARLYDATGNRSQVRVVMSDLLRRAAKVPLYVAFYAGWLLRAGDAREAGEWVNRLAKLQPDSFQTAELRARLMAAEKNLPAARAALLPHADGPNAPVEAVARVCEEVGLYEDAERLLKRFGAENKAARPQAVLALAAFYGRRGRTDDALAVCQDARATVPGPAVGGVAVAALYAAPKADPAAAAKVAGWLTEAAGRADGEGRAALVQQLASVRSLQGDHAAAVALYRQALAANGKDALAMNNLAFLLSVGEGKHDEALAVLDRAKRLIGPHPVLADTEAVVRLNRGEVAAARRLLEGVQAEAPSGAASFHLAEVELAGKRDLEARIAWKQAEEAGLRRSDLHVLEQPAYDRIAARMK